MWLHFLIFAYILIAYLLFGKIRKNNKLFVFFVFLMFFILASFRDISVGNDTAEYYRVFKLIYNQNSIVSALNVTRYETGYLLLNYVVTRFTSSFTVLLAIISATYLLSVIMFLKRYSDSVEISIILFFTMSSYYVLMNIERQCIAVAIMLFAFSFLEEKKYLRFLVLVFLAASFHSMAIVFIIFMFLPKINMSISKQVLKWGILCFAGLIFICLMAQRILVYFPYYQHYFNETNYGTGGVRIASLVFFGIRFFVFVLVYIVGGFQYQIDNDDSSIELLNKIMISDCVIAAASISFNMYDRLEGYLCLGYIISITNAVNNLHSRLNRKIITVLFVGITFTYATATLLFRGNWSGIFPYSFIN